MRPRLQSIAASTRRLPVSGWSTTTDCLAHSTRRPARRSPAMSAMPVRVRLLRAVCAATALSADAGSARSRRLVDTRAVTEKLPTASCCQSAGRRLGRHEHADAPGRASSCCAVPLADGQVQRRHERRRSGCTDVEQARGLFSRERDEVKAVAGLVGGLVGGKAGGMRQAVAQPLDRRARARATTDYGGVAGRTGRSRPARKSSARPRPASPAYAPAMASSTRRAPTPSAAAWLTLSMTTSPSGWRARQTAMGGRP